MLGSLLFLLLFVTAGPKPAPPPVGFLEYLGEYERDASNRLIVRESNGALEVVVGNASPQTLRAAGKDRFEGGGKTYQFERNAQGRLRAVRAGAEFVRRTDFPEDGAVFRIQAVRPVEELRREAVKKSPPVESGKRKAELVDLQTLPVKLHLDIRYATSNNFMGAPMYSQARAFLQKPAAEALARAAADLEKQGFGLLIHDAYRPWYVTWMFWEATPTKQRKFVANPAEGSRHNRGCAVDLSMYDLATGKPVNMVSVYDEMTDRAYPDYAGGTSLARWQRAVLREAMEKQGFTVNVSEWWHFDYKDWKQYPIGTARFEDLR